MQGWEVATLGTSVTFLENIPNKLVHLTMEISWLRILSVHKVPTEIKKRERERNELKRNCFSFLFKAAP